MNLYENYTQNNETERKEFLEKLAEENIKVLISLVNRHYKEKRKEWYKFKYNNDEEFKQKHNNRQKEYRKNKNIE